MGNIVVVTRVLVNLTVLRSVRIFASSNEANDEPIKGRFRSLKIVVGKKDERT
jgi:hypothetical protein